LTAAALLRLTASERCFPHLLYLQWLSCGPRLDLRRTMIAPLSVTIALGREMIFSFP